MHHTFVNQLCCPACHGKLKLHTDAKTEDVLEGTIECARCLRVFSIHRGVPHLFLRWEPPLIHEPHPFKEYLVSSDHVAFLASQTGADRVHLNTLVNPYLYFPVHYNKIFFGLRMVFWGCFLLAILIRRQASVWITAGLVGFLIDWLILHMARKHEYKLEVAQLLQHSKEGRLHMKDDIEDVPDAQQLDVHEMAENRLDDISQVLKGIHFRDKDVLHVGCGGEQDADVAQVYHQQGARLVGLDVYVPSVIDFKRIFSAEGLTAEALRLPFPDQSFDFTNCTDIIEHVHDPFHFLQENWRVLKPGGQMLLVTPNRCRVRRSCSVLNPFVFFQSALGSRLSSLLFEREMVAIHRNFVFYHTSFTISELKALLSAAGFRISWLRIKAYRGPFKRLRGWIECLPLLNTVNDSLFALAEKPL